MELVPIGSAVAASLPRPVEPSAARRPLPADFDGRPGLPGPVRPRAARPPDLGHGPLQLPLPLLHAGRGVRARLRVPARARRCCRSRRSRGSRAIFVGLGRPQAPDHRRRAARPPRPAGAHRPARAAPHGRRRAGRPHADDQRVRAAGARGAARRGRPAADHRQPRLARRRGVRRDERRRLPGRRGCSTGSRPRARPASRRSRSTPSCGAGMNEASILPLARWARDEGLILRFIEYMDVGHSNGWRLDDVVPGRGDPGDDRRRAAARAGRRELPRRGRRPLPVPRRRRRGGRDRLGHPAVLRRLHARATVGGGHLYTCLFAVAGTDLKTPAAGRRVGRRARRRGSRRSGASAPTATPSCAARRPSACPRWRCSPSAARPRGASWSHRRVRPQVVHSGGKRGGRRAAEIRRGSWKTPLVTSAAAAVT